MNRDSDPQPLVVIACPGAGIVNRGYETFALDLATHLQDRTDIAVLLLSGGPVDAKWARRIPTLRRDGLSARFLARRLRVQPSLVEQVSFAVSSLVGLRRLAPDTVLFSERAVGAVLARVLSSPAGRLWRRRPRLILSNGGGSPPPYPWCDVVQHVTPLQLQVALDNGEPPGKHVCLPYAFEPPSDVGATRRPSGLPPDRPVILSVGSIDSSRKRMDHLVAEVAKLDPRPYVMLVGPQGDETPGVRELAESLLGPGQFGIASATPGEVHSYYDSADLFVLASTEEAFGRVYAEAMMHGLLCIAHDFPVARYVLGDDGVFVDMAVDGALSSALEGLLGSPGTWNGAEGSRVRREHAEERFSWEKLLPRYVDLLTGNPVVKKP